MTELPQLYCHNRRRSSIAALSVIAFLIFASTSAISITPSQQLVGRRLGGGGAAAAAAAVHEGGWRRSTTGQTGTEEDMEGSSVMQGGMAIRRRRLGGPGSSPPTCRSKCSRCTPCKPVQVPIQPGFSLPLEYYPEAWRCKCANKLFMP